MMIEGRRARREGVRGPRVGCVCRQDVDCQHALAARPGVHLPRTRSSPAWDPGAWRNPTPILDDAGTRPRANHELVRAWPFHGDHRHDGPTLRRFPGEHVHGARACPVAREPGQATGQGAKVYIRDSGICTRFSTSGPCRHGAAPQAGRIVGGLLYRVHHRTARCAPRAMLLLGHARWRRPGLACRGRPDR